MTQNNPAHADKPHPVQAVDVGGALLSREELLRVTDERK